MSAVQRVHWILCAASGIADATWTGASTVLVLELDMWERRIALRGLVLLFVVLA